jgi:hypothetical protein
VSMEVTRLCGVRGDDCNADGLCVSHDDRGMEDDLEMVGTRQFRGECGGKGKRCGPLFLSRKGPE